MKGSNKKLIRNLLIICGVLIFCLLLVIIILGQGIKQEAPQSKENNYVQEQEEKEEKITNNIRNKGEKERIQIYLAEYIKHLENGEYSYAYKKLNTDFKRNYFPLIDDFIEYAKLRYSDLMSIEYNDVQRQGNYYIMDVTITNLQDLQTTINQKFIIQENEINDYQMSFQVK